MPAAPISSPILSGESNTRLQVWNDALNPILVKELRQLYKSRQFVWIFFLLLAVAWAISATALFAPAAILQFVPLGYGHTGQIHGAALFYTLFCCLTVAMNFAVPLRAMESLAHELSAETMEMMILTPIPADRITTGKFWCAALHMGLYFAAFGPFIAVTYLLPGIDLLTIVILLIASLVVSGGLTCIALWLGSYCRSPVTRSMLVIVLLAGCLLITWYWLQSVYWILTRGTSGGMLCMGIPCFMVPWLVVTSSALGSAVVRVRPTSPFVNRLEYLTPNQLQWIANGVLALANALRVQFPVEYDEPPARVPTRMPFREAQRHVLELARRAERMMNRSRRPFHLVVSHAPLVHRQIREPFGRMRQRFYTLLTLYDWATICHDGPSVHNWPDRVQMPKLRASRLDDLEASARALLAACEATSEQ